MRTTENRIFSDFPCHNFFLEDFRRALRRFDSSLCGCGELRRLHGERNAEFAITKNLQTAIVLHSFCKTVFHNEAVVNHRTCGKLRKVSKVYDHVYLFTNVVETSLRYTTRDGHLTAFKAGANATAGTSPLTFVALTGRFT